MKRGLLAAATLLLALTGVQLVDAAPVVASVGCYQTSCNGKDPNQMGCDVGAQTIEQYVEPDGDKLELRKSTTCWSAWVRYTSASYTFTGIVEGFNTNCHPQSYQSCWPAASSEAPFGDSIHSVPRWSDMVSFTYWVRVCEVDVYDIVYEATCTKER